MSLGLKEFTREEIRAIYNSNPCYKIRIYQKSLDSNELKVRIETEAIGLDLAIQEAQKIALQSLRRKFSIEEIDNLRKTLSYNTLGWQLLIERV